VPARLTDTGAESSDTASEMNQQIQPPRSQNQTLCASRRAPDPLANCGVEALIPSNLPEPVRRELALLVESAQAAFGDELKSVVLFGSAAEGMLRPTSDVNLLLLLGKFDSERADRLREPLRRISAAIHLHAMFLLEAELPAAMEAFAVKFGDIVRRHHVLHGSDPFAGISPAPEKALARLKQILLNLAVRMREAYLLRSLREEQLVFVISEMTGPLRACAATLLELQGTPAASGKEALARVASTLLASPADTTLMEHISQARQTRALPAGTATSTFHSLRTLAEKMWAQANAM
jgi:hypothetical protein